MISTAARRHVSLISAFISAPDPRAHEPTMMTDMYKNGSLCFVAGPDTFVCGKFVGLGSDNCTAVSHGPFSSCTPVSVFLSNDIALPRLPSMMATNLTSAVGVTPSASAHCAPTFLSVRALKASVCPAKSLYAPAVTGMAGSPKPNAPTETQCQDQCCNHSCSQHLLCSILVCGSVARLAIRCRCHTHPTFPACAVSATHLLLLLHCLIPVALTIPRAPVQ
jgi:hypothetical protein